MTGSAFNQCPDLNILEVDEDNTYFCSLYYFIFNKAMTKLVRAHTNFSTDIIPNKENVVALGKFMMSGSTLEEYIGWNNLLSIEFCVLHANHPLKFVDLSISVPSKCFNLLNQLILINLPEDLSTISTNAILDSYALKAIYIPMKVSSIQDSAIYQKSFSENDCLFW